MFAAMRVFSSLVLMVLVAAGCHSQKAPAQPVGNAAAPAATAPAAAPAAAAPAATTDCTAIHGCTPCIQQLCQWDLKGHSCSSDCKSDDCLETGALKPLPQDDAARVCNGSRAGS